MAAIGALVGAKGDAGPPPEDARAYIDAFAATVKSFYPAMEPPPAGSSYEELPAGEARVCSVEVDEVKGTVRVLGVGGADDTRAFVGSLLGGGGPTPVGRKLSAAFSRALRDASSAAQPPPPPPAPTAVAAAFAAAGVALSSPPPPPAAPRPPSPGPSVAASRFASLRSSLVTATPLSETPLGGLKCAITHPSVRDGDGEGAALSVVHATLSRPDSIIGEELAIGRPVSMLLMPMSPDEAAAAAEAAGGGGGARTIVRLKLSRAHPLFALRAIEHAISTLAAPPSSSPDNDGGEAAAPARGGGGGVAVVAMSRDPGKVCKAVLRFTGPCAADHARRWAGTIDDGPKAVRAILGPSEVFHAIPYPWGNNNDDDETPAGGGGGGSDSLVPAPEPDAASTALAEAFVASALRPAVVDRVVVTGGGGAFPPRPTTPLDAASVSAAPPPSVSPPHAELRTALAVCADDEGVAKALGRSGCNVKAAWRLAKTLFGVDSLDVRMEGEADDAGGGGGAGGGGWEAARRAPRPPRGLGGALAGLRDGAGRPPPPPPLPPPPPAAPRARRWDASRRGFVDDTGADSPPPPPPPPPFARPPPAARGERAWSDDDEPVTRSPGFSRPFPAFSTAASSTPFSLPDGPSFLTSLDALWDGLSPDDAAPQLPPQPLSASRAFPPPPPAAAAASSAAAPPPTASAFFGETDEFEEAPGDERWGYGEESEGEDVWGLAPPSSAAAAAAAAPAPRPPPPAVDWAREAALPLGPGRGPADATDDGYDARRNDGGGGGEAPRERRTRSYSTGKDGQDGAARPGRGGGGGGFAGGGAEDAAPPPRRAPPRPPRPSQGGAAGEAPNWADVWADLRGGQGDDA